jgi:hypothetical protein
MRNMDNEICQKTSYGLVHDVFPQVRVHVQCAGTQWHEFDNIVLEWHVVDRWSGVDGGSTQVWLPYLSACKQQYLLLPNFVPNDNNRLSMLRRALFLLSYS